MKAITKIQLDLIIDNMIDEADRLFEEANETYQNCDSPYNIKAWYRAGQYEVLNRLKKRLNSLDWS